MKEIERKLQRASYALPFASDAPVRDDLERLGYEDLRLFLLEDGTVRSYRSRIRYLAALLPSMAIPALAEALHAVVDNKSMTVGDVRFILEGRRLDNPQLLTAEVPVTAIQKVGEVLADGGSHLEAARRAGVSVDTVQRIDEYLEISQAVEDRLMDTAIAAARDGWTVSRLAEVSGMSRSRAHRYLVRARSVLAELGEVSE
jgi:AraC-like DNA-binding protein